jgi:hypothetical protein
MEQVGLWVCVSKPVRGFNECMGIKQKTHPHTHTHTVRGSRTDRTRAAASTHHAVMLDMVEEAEDAADLPVPAGPAPLVPAPPTVAAAPAAVVEPTCHHGVAMDVGWGRGRGGTSPPHAPGRRAVVGSPPPPAAAAAAAATAAAAAAAGVRAVAGASTVAVGPELNNVLGGDRSTGSGSWGRPAATGPPARCSTLGLSQWAAPMPCGPAMRARACRLVGGGGGGAGAVTAATSAAAVVAVVAGVVAVVVSGTPDPGPGALAGGRSAWGALLRRGATNAAGTPACMVRGT